ncbi:MAG: HlyD family efflux transporter periplasmic adaptor subunit [Flavobacteriales bacterium]|nr:HlyD family efflux transporter periplasmic adaptor subunit [Flavobacteriales bacterium]
MKKRQLIIIAVALAIIVLARLASNFIGTPPERPAPTPVEKVNTVFVDTVALAEIPISIRSTGRVEAIDRVVLYSEVQGMMLPDGGRFRAGNRFKRGDVLFRIRSNDQRAAVVSARSSFLQTLSTVMADIRLDHPDEYPNWDAFLTSADAEDGIPSLPENISQGLERFLTGRGVLSSYYTVRNAEAQLSKYTVRAPFNGVLTEASAVPGTVLRQNTEVGVFLKPGQYEIETAVDRSTIDLLSVGREVEVTESMSGDSWAGTVKRINSAVDPSTQLCSFFTHVQADDLEDGTYVDVSVQAEQVKEAYVVSRSTLIDEKALYTVVDSLLHIRPIQVIHIEGGNAIVKGLKNGDVILEQVPPDAFEGMQVAIYTKEEDQ